MIATTLYNSLPPCRVLDGERQVLSQAGHIFLKKVLQVDTHAKKGDPTEPKILVSPL